MPRRSRNSSKLAKNNSTLVYDVSNSQIFPIATSSPRSSDCIPLLTPEKFDDIVTSIKNEFKAKIEQGHKERQLKLLNLEKEIMANESLNRAATASDFKSLRKVMEFLENSSCRDSNRRATRTIRENETGLPAIPEEVLSPGNNVESENCVSSSTEDIRPTEKGKAGKKLKIVSEKSDDEDESVFKKPTGRGKRTLKNSQLTNGYQTPKMKMRYNVASVTPGPNCNRPINILRQPNPGELAISMTGSPLLIATHNNIQNHVPQISIPLSDGRVMTVLADEALDPDMSLCSEIDIETQERLKILQKLLSKKTKAIID